LTDVDVGAVLVSDGEVTSVPSEGCDVTAVVVELMVLMVEVELTAWDDKLLTQRPSV
jgi:hypothetical protein